MEKEINETLFGMKKDLLFMKQALAQAKRAYDHNEVPIGAVIVSKEGEIIARAYNKVEKECSQVAHAELIVLNKAGKKMGDWRLNGCFVYVTLEPCSMCLNALYLSRCAGIVFSASSPKFGYRLDNTQSNQIYKKASMIIVKGIAEAESSSLLRKFFNKKRSL